VLRALAALGEGWHTRREIASTFGRRTLYETETKALESLVQDGLVQVRRRTAKGPILTVYIYRYVKGVPNVT
jgi:hypothetical protein